MKFPLLVLFATGALSGKIVYLNLFSVIIFCIQFYIFLCCSHFGQAFGLCCYDGFAKNLHSKQVNFYSKLLFSDTTQSIHAMDYIFVYLLCIVFHVYLQIDITCSLVFLLTHIYFYFYMFGVYV